MVQALTAYETMDRSGVVHAVLVADDRSLCGLQMLTFGERPWPVLPSQWAPDRQPCLECSALVYGL